MLWQGHHWNEIAQDACKGGRTPIDSMRTYMDRVTKMYVHPGVDVAVPRALSTCLCVVSERRQGWSHAEDERLQEAVRVGAIPCWTLGVLGSSTFMLSCTERTIGTWYQFMLGHAQGGPARFALMINPKGSARVGSPPPKIASCRFW